MEEASKQKQLGKAVTSNSNNENEINEKELSKDYVGQNDTITGKNVIKSQTSELNNEDTHPKVSEELPKENKDEDLYQKLIHFIQMDSIFTMQYVN